jgi:hypothetical protein
MHEGVDDVRSHLTAEIPTLHHVDDRIEWDPNMMLFLGSKIYGRS